MSTNSLSPVASSINVRPSSPFAFGSALKYNSSTQKSVWSKNIYAILQQDNVFYAFYVHVRWDGKCNENKPFFKEELNSFFVIIGHCDLCHIENKEVVEVGFNLIWVRQRGKDMYINGFFWQISKMLSDFKSFREFCREVSVLLVIDRHGKSLWLDQDSVLILVKLSRSNSDFGTAGFQSPGHKMKLAF